MFESLNKTNEAEALVLTKLRVWIAALAVVCVLTGMGIGAILAGRPAVAQNELQSAVRAPEALSASFVEIARRVEPAVVNIDTLQASDLPETDNEDKTDRTPSNPLYDMLRRQPPRPTRGVGSGFIIDAKGYIVTNQHVIEGATRITVGLLTGERFRATVVGIDPETFAIAFAEITAATGTLNFAARSALLGVPSNRPITPSIRIRSASRAA